MRDHSATRRSQKASDVSERQGMGLDGTSVLSPAPRVGRARQGRRRERRCDGRRMHDDGAQWRIDRSVEPRPGSPSRGAFTGGAVPVTSGGVEVRYSRVVVRVGGVVVSVAPPRVSNALLRSRAELPRSRVALPRSRAAIPRARAAVRRSRAAVSASRLTIGIHLCGSQRDDNGPRWRRQSLIERGRIIERSPTENVERRRIRTYGRASRCIRVR